MEKYVETFIMVIAYSVFKYSIYYIAETVGMSKKLSLIPGYDIAVLFKYAGLPVWHMIIACIPAVNAFYAIYLLIKNPRAFFTLIPLFTPVVVYYDAKGKNIDKEKNILDIVINVMAIIYKCLLIFSLGVIFILGGFIFVIAYIMYMKKYGNEIMLWSLISDYLKF